MEHLNLQAIAESSCEEVFKVIGSRQKSALGFHSQMANLFDFLSLHGFKRLHEYQYMSESAEYRSICRYYINHHNKLIICDLDSDIQVIPQDWVEYTRFDVTPQVRKQAVEKAFKEYRTWESDTKELYSHCTKRLMELGWVSDSLKVGSMVNDVDQELKTLDRLMLRLQVTSYDPIEMADMQDELHEHYRVKTKEIGVDIC